MPQFTSEDEFDDIMRARIEELREIPDELLRRFDNLDGVYGAETLE